MRIMSVTNQQVQNRSQNKVTFGESKHTISKNSAKQCIELLVPTEFEKIFEKRPDDLKNLIDTTVNAIRNAYHDFKTNMNFTLTTHEADLGGKDIVMLDRVADNKVTPVAFAGIEEGVTDKALNEFSASIMESPAIS